MKKADAKINTIIGKDTLISGDFTAKGSVRLDGSIEGEVKVEGTLIIGATGRVNGSIGAAATVIGGEVFGDVDAPEKIEITSTAKVIGNLKTNIIVIDEKAVFQGQCDMNQEVAEGARPKKRMVRETRAGRKSAKDALKEALMEMEAENRNENGEDIAASAELDRDIENV